MFSPLKYINFILLVNLNFFFQKRFIWNHFRYNYCCFHQFQSWRQNQSPISRNFSKLVKTAIIVSKMISNEAFLKKKKFRLTKSIKLMYFKGENNVRRSLNIKFWNCTDLLFGFLESLEMLLTFCWHIFDKKRAPRYHEYWKRSKSGCNKEGSNVYKILVLNQCKLHFWNVF